MNRARNLSRCAASRVHRLLRREADAGAGTEVVRDVTLFTAQRTTVPDFVEATGTVRAAQSAQLSSQVMGRWCCW